jgi:hypothetical protein
MRHRRGLSGSVSRFSCRAAQLSGRAHGVSGGGTGLRHGDLTSYPSVRLLNRAARTVVTGLRFLEEMQDVPRAISRPHGKKAMIAVLEGAAATHGNKPGITRLAENHVSLHVLL